MHDDVPPTRPATPATNARPTTSSATRPTHRPTHRPTRRLLFAATALAACLSLAVPAAAAASRVDPRVDPTPVPPLVEPLPAPTGELIEITDFGPNPTDLDMHLYVPHDVQRRPEVLVALHYCTGSGPAMFGGTDYASLADVYGFVVIYPSATRAGQCFDVSSPSTLTRGGGSDPQGIVSMVEYVQRELRGDRTRVYVTGISSGAMMTSVMLATYPDVFAAGSVMSGVPHGCFATSDGSEWNNACADGLVDLTPQEWAALVDDAYPGYRGQRPRVQLWHGTADDTLDVANLGEGVEQWTEVLGTRPEPSLVDHPRAGWTHEAYTSRSGRTLVDAYTLRDAPHAVALSEPWLEQLAVDFFGLDQRGGRP